MKKRKGRKQSIRIKQQKEGRTGEENIENKGRNKEEFKEEERMN